MSCKVGKGWTAIVGSCTECGSSADDRADVQGRCVKCKKAMKRKWPGWLDGCLSCGRGPGVAPYMKIGLCRRCYEAAASASKGDGLSIWSVGVNVTPKVPDGLSLVSLWDDVFDEHRQRSKAGTSQGSRMVKSIIGLMGLRETVVYMKVTEKTVVTWLLSGVPRKYRLWVALKKSLSSSWRPSAIPPMTADDAATSCSWWPMDDAVDGE